MPTVTQSFPATLPLTATQNFPATESIDPPTSARRLLAGGEGAPRSHAARAPAATVARPASKTSTQGGAAWQDALPDWAKGVVIGGVLLALGMPVTVLMSRSMLVQSALAEQSTSKAAMLCTAGEGRAMDDSSLIGWLFGGSYFACGDWETREARVQRERDRDHASYMARERAKQQYR